MPLPDPQLDDRRFQDIVDEAKTLIPRYCPEWTDHNVSDPGVTLIELFAWMTDLTLYRLNRVPEKNYLRFMELLGIRLKQPVAARTDITIALSAAQPGPITISRGTEVGTVRTGDQPSTIFSTDNDLTIVPPTLQRCLISPDGVNFTDRTGSLDQFSDPFEAFQHRPLPGDAMYLGFAENLSRHTLTLGLQCDREGVGVDPRNPPLSWEAWCGDTLGWVPVHVQSDETGGLNRTGDVVLHLPAGMDRLATVRQDGYWVRVRVVQPAQGQPTYSASPRIHTIAAAATGGTVSGTHATVVINELLGNATGIPGETLILQHTPVLPLEDYEYLEIQDDASGEWFRWSRVESLIESGPLDRHYTLDPVTGTITFGPIIRQPDGAERQYGMTPRRGDSMRFVRYRYGGGVVGNVGANTLTVLKSSIPYVSTVVNLRAATGGLDAESLEAAKLRAPATLRSQERAVTAEDFEFLAMEADRTVARARCIQVRGDGRGSSVPPGTIELLVVPVIPDDLERTLDTLQPPPALIESVRRYLDDRRMLGTQLVIDGPDYVGVSVEAVIVVSPGVPGDRVRARVAEALTRYLDPIHGGPVGLGWPFGRDFYLSEVQSVIQSVHGVEYAQDVTIVQVDTQTGQARAAGQRIAIADDVLLLPYAHVITLAERGR